MTSLTREHVTALNHRAVELYRAGDRDQAAETALRAYAAASELCPPDEFLRLGVTQNTAAMLESMGAADGAIELYREIVQVESEENRQRRAYAHERLFEVYSARSEWRDAAAEGDASFEAWEARGEPADETLL